MPVHALLKTFPYSLQTTHDRPSIVSRLMSFLSKLHVAPPYRTSVRPPSTQARRGGGGMTMRMTPEGIYIFPYIPSDDTIQPVRKLCLPFRYIGPPIGMWSAPRRFPSYFDCITVYIVRLRHACVALHFAIALRYYYILYCMLEPLCHPLQRVTGVANDRLRR